MESRSRKPHSGKLGPAVTKDLLRVLLPLDGSSEAESILAAVLPLAERRPLRMTLLGAISTTASRSDAEAYLTRAEAALRRPGLDVRVVSCRDEPAAAIVAHAISDRSDLIAMTTHGRSGMKRLLMGSITEKVLRQAPAPLITCRSGSRMEGWAHVVPLDGSLRAETILDDILPLSRLVGATVHLLHVGSPADGRRYLAKVALQVSERGVPVTTALRQGKAAAEILSYAAEVRAGVIALATHGRTGLERALMGSVAEDVLRQGSCPVVLRRELREPSRRPLSTV
jgi:nucleotide-binding universal stress UspA family protein